MKRKNETKIYTMLRRRKKKKKKMTKKKKIYKNQPEASSCLQFHLFASILTFSINLNITFDVSCLIKKFTEGIKWNISFSAMR